jgi:hypothetical protein
MAADGPIAGKPAPTGSAVRAVIVEVHPARWAALSFRELDRESTAAGVGADSSAIGGEAVVKPKSRVLLTHRGLRFYGRFAPNRG